MAEPTPEDRENYKNLVNAAKKLNTALEGNLPVQQLKSLLSPLTTQAIPSLNTLDQLEDHLSRAEAYLNAQKFILTETNAEIDKATQSLNEKVDLIRASLEVIKNGDLSDLDDLNPPCTSADFLDRLKDVDPVKVKTWTQQLLIGSPPNLDSSQVEKLTTAWGVAIAEIVEDSRKKGDELEPGKLDTIVQFFCIHEELEALYDKLPTVA